MINFNKNRKLTFYTKPENFTTIFHSEQFDYFKSQGFNFGLISQNGGYLMAMAKTEDELIKNYSVKICKDQNDFVFEFLSGLLDYQYITTVNPIVGHKENLHFLSYFCKKHPQYSNTVLRDYYNYLPNLTINNNDIKTQHEDRLLNIATVFMNNLSHTQVLAFIPNFPVYTWAINTIPLPKLVYFLKEKQFHDTEIDETLFLFLNSRKKQLDDMIISTEVKYFLLDHYSKDLSAIDKYMEFLPSLKSHFETPEVSFVKNIEEYSLNLIINIKDMKKSFLIDQWNESNYTDSIEHVVGGIKQYYNIPTALVVTVDNDPMTGKNIGIFMMHDKPEYTKKWFQQIFTEFFSYLRTEPHFVINVDNVNKWCQNRDLTNKIELIDLNTTNTKKLKI